MHKKHGKCHQTVQITFSEQGTGKQKRKENQQILEHISNYYLSYTSNTL